MSQSGLRIHFRKELSFIESSRPVSPDATGSDLFSPFAAGFPGGATAFQPYIRWPHSLIELVISISFLGNNINDCDLKSRIFAEVDDLWITGRS